MRSVLERLTPPARATPRSFNALRALGVARREISHSALLAALLEPSGDHGQGKLFLRSFLQRMADQVESFPRVSPDVLWVVERECSLPNGGRVDILLRASDESHWIAIENKIYAQDGDGQIDKYFAGLKSLAGSSETHLVYLTLDGRTPRRSAASPACVSYASHIIPWLESVLEDVPISYPAVAGLVEQWMTVLIELTGGPRVPTNPELVALLARPENVEFAKQISDAMPAVSDALEERLWNEVAAHIADEATRERWAVQPMKDQIQAAPAELNIAFEQEETLHCIVAAQHCEAAIICGVSWTTNTLSPRAAARAASSQLRGALAADFPETDDWWLAFCLYRDSWSGFSYRDVADGSLSCWIAERMLGVMQKHRQLLVDLNRALARTRDR